MSLSITFVILTQWLMGFGVMTRLRAVSNGFSLLGLSMLTGLGISSMLPILLELAQVPIAATPVCIGLGILAGLSLLGLQGQGTYLRGAFAGHRLSVRLYELPFLIFWGYLLVISAWKSAWFPNLPFDTIVGPDLVATFAVREHRLVSSVFTEHLQSVSIFSNQPFYAPFTAMQQIIYLVVAEGIGPFAFGKLWLTVLVAAFGLFFYAELRERIHPILAGVLLSVLACSPELFAYTFLVQTDWANAAFLATGMLLLQRYFVSGQRGALVATGLLLALACWTRTETIFFMPIGAILVIAKSETENRKEAFIAAVGLLLVCLLPVLFWNYGFLRGYVSLPANAHLGTLHAVSGNYLSKLLAVFQGMNTQVVFHASYWNYAVPIFLALAPLNIILFRDKRGLSILVWIIGIYVLFGLLILHVDGANIPFTFRRGFFKLLFLMYSYLGASSLALWLSNRLYHWEAVLTQSPQQ